MSTYHKYLEYNRKYQEEYRKRYPNGSPNPPTKKCLRCDKQFPYKASHAAHRKYCSKSCSATARVGVLAANWRGGTTTETERLKGSQRYRDWRKAVFTRDHFTCVICGDDRGGNLEADHIKPQAYFPELRFETDNGRTLCRDCHRATDTWGSKAKLIPKEI